MDKQNNISSSFDKDVAAAGCSFPTGSPASPLLLSAKEASKMLSIGRTLFYGLHSSARIPEPVRLGNRTLWNRSELEQWTNCGCPSREKWNQIKNGKNA